MVARLSCPLKSVVQEGMWPADDYNSVLWYCWWVTGGHPAYIKTCATILKGYFSEQVEDDC